MHLERYPHITNKIEALWGTKECRLFLLGLIADGRDGKRQGLPPEVAREIMAILHSHDESYPAFDDSAQFVEMTYRAMPREVPVVHPHDGVVMKFIAKITAFGVGLVLLVEAIRRTL